MSETGIDSESGESLDDEAVRAARREERRRAWLEKRMAQEAAGDVGEDDPTPVERLVDVALTPTYIAIGAAIIVYRKVMGLPPVTTRDYD